MKEPVPTSRSLAVPPELKLELELKLEPEFSLLEWELPSCSVDFSNARESGLGMQMSRPSVASHWPAF